MFHTYSEIFRKNIDTQLVLGLSVPLFCLCLHFNQFFLLSVSSYLSMDIPHFSGKSHGKITPCYIIVIFRCEEEAIIISNHQLLMHYRATCNLWTTSGNRWTTPYTYQDQQTVWQTDMTITESRTRDCLCCRCVDSFCCSFELSATVYKLKTKLHEFYFWMCKSTIPWRASCSKQSPQ